MAPCTTKVPGVSGQMVSPAAVFQRVESLQGKQQKLREGSKKHPTQREQAMGAWP